MASRRHTRVRATCAFCGRLHVSESRLGLTFTCKHCGARQAGPGMPTPPPTPPNASQRYRMRRKEALARIEDEPPRRRGPLRRLFGGGS